MRSFRSKPVGWRYESHRHSLAAKGFSTKSYFAEKISPSGSYLNGMYVDQFLWAIERAGYRKGYSDSSPGRSFNLIIEIQEKRFGEVPNDEKLKMWSAFQKWFLVKHGNEKYAKKPSDKNDDESLRRAMSGAGVDNGESYFSRKKYFALTRNNYSGSSSSQGVGMKEFRKNDDGASPYVEMQVLHVANYAPSKSTEKYYVEMYKWVRGKSSHVLHPVESVEVGRGLIDGVQNYEQGVKLMKSLGGDGE